MQKSVRLLLLIALSAYSLSACDENASTSSQSCSESCKPGETCSEGKCLCGNQTCSADQECVQNECRDLETPPTNDDACSPMCKPGETCSGGKCLCGNQTCAADQECVQNECRDLETPPTNDDTCSPACKPGETCSGGKCLCGNQACSADQECAENTCINVIIETPCGDLCASGETCVEGKCMCGNETCASGEECVNGKCESVCEGDACIEEIPCIPECPEDKTCAEGKCIDLNLCEPECAENEVCIEGQCKPSTPDLCADVMCENDSVCVVSGDKAECKCGSAVCNDEQICKSGKCEWKDPCHNVGCINGEICVEGTCVDQIIPDSTALDIMFSTKTHLSVKKHNTEKLTWKLENKTNSAILCKVNDTKYVNADDMSQCIVYDDAKKTESITFVGFTRSLKSNKLIITNTLNTSVTIALTSKPYFGTDGFMKVTAKGGFPSNIIYRNGYYPGQNVTNYDTYQSKDSAFVNIAGEGNPYGGHKFTQDEINTFDKDMYEKFIRPNMLKHENSYYGTRASVLAAARFLVLQFPYDIPYYTTGVNNIGQSHYVWAYHNDKVEKELSKVNVYGLSLDNNMYNSQTNHKESNILRSDVVAWGSLIKGKSAEKREFAGLECSGFVAWTFRNGHLGLGDWTTHMFGSYGICKDAQGKSVRNYKCEKIVNHDPAVLKAGWCNSCSNPNNYLNSAYKKLSKLQDSDFIQIDQSSVEELKVKLRDIKAGDLLWSGSYTNPEKTEYNHGHIAMIIGIKRDGSGIPTAIYVAEATGKYAGNKLTKYGSLEEFKGGKWVKPESAASFVIRMDNVYNYYSDIYKITTESAKSDCPNGQKSGGNCYNYTEMYNPEFNSAIMNITF